MAAKPELPASVTDNRIVLVGVAAIFLAIFAGPAIPGLSPYGHAFLLMGAFALTVGVLEVVFLKVHRRSTTGLDWSRPLVIDPSRILCKLLGILATLAVVFAVHAVFRIYSLFQLSISVYALELLFPALVIVTVAYVVLTDSRMDDPHDDYWTVGAVLLGRAPMRSLSGLRDHALSWSVKGFFLPIMFFGLTVRMAGAENTFGMLGDGTLTTVLGMVSILLMVDLTFACVGYALTIRVLDAHIRSPNPLLGAWLVTLICYEPFNRITGEIAHWSFEQDWTDIVAVYPALLVPWSAALLLSYVVWIWATAIYGLRWSNLTNRGIVTSGPYRYTKHPDYVSKSIFFWLTALPFYTAVEPWQAITGTCALIFVNFIYYGRAKMEEKHLSDDPVYVAYALAMNERSVFRGVARWLPFLIYRAPGAVEERSEDWKAAGAPAE